MEVGSLEEAPGSPSQPPVKGGLVPVLQIVHVTDLHVKDPSSNGIAILSKKARLLRRFVAQRVQRHDIAGWEEGTQGHLIQAPKAFEKFLADWRAGWPKWADVPVWLVDTGDRTAFGDADSIAAGGRMLDRWSQALGGCPVRTLYGNHDMWPQALPLLNRGDVRTQWDRVRSVPGWEAPTWLTQPLSAPLPDGKATIDLYALDTIAWGSVLGPVKNTLAVGQLRGQDLLHFRMLLEGMVKRGGTGLRILGLHHPVSFPWIDSEVSCGVLPTMKLLNEHKWGSVLRNDGGLPEGIGPWAHVLLSGHTHMSHPAGGLSGDVASVAQSPLGQYQVQLVGSSLMLNRGSKSIKAGDPKVEDRNVDGFAPSTVYHHPCQAQILRFYASADPEEPWIQMVRIPIYSDNSGRQYVAGQQDDLLLHYRLPT